MADIIIDSDSGKFKAGGDQDLEVYNDGSHSYIKNTVDDQTIVLATSTGGATTTAVTVDGSNNVTMAGNIIMADDTSIGISDSDERIEFDGAGDISVLGANVGIGTSSPSQMLHINGAVPSILFTDATNGDLGFIGDAQDFLTPDSPGADSFGLRSQGDIRLGTGGNNLRMTIDSSGKVGIGTASPGFPLEISNDAAEHLRIRRDGSHYWDIQVGSGGNLAFQKNAATDNLLLDASGNVGIGATSISSRATDMDNTGPVLELFHNTQDSALQLGSDSGGRGLDLWSDHSGANVYFDSRYDSSNTSGGNIFIRTRTADETLTAISIDQATNTTFAGDVKASGGKRFITQDTNNSGDVRSALTFARGDGSGLAWHVKTTGGGSNDVSSLYFAREGTMSSSGYNTTGVALNLDASGNATFSGMVQIADSYGGYILQIHNDGNHDAYRGIDIKVGQDSPTGTNYVMRIADGDDSEQGLITFSGGTVTYGAFTANHEVELSESDNENGYPYGTLVEHTELFYKQKNGSDTERGILYKVQKSSSAYSKSVLGAYSSKHATDVHENLHQVYVLGDGHILCNGEKGNIEIGDGICSSSTDGEGMKADKMAMIIGIAQEDVSFSGSESKLVAVQYGLQQFTPWENA